MFIGAMIFAGLFVAVAIAAIVVGLVEVARDGHHAVPTRRF